MLLSLGLIANSSFALPAKTKPTPDPTKAAPISPQQRLNADVTDFIKQLNTAKDFPELQSYVSVDRVGYFNAIDWFDEWKKDRTSLQVVINQIHVDKMQGDSATVTVTYHLHDPHFQSKIERQLFKETLALIYQQEPLWTYLHGKVWQIIPTAQEPPQDYAMLLSGYVLRRAAYGLAQKNWNYTTAARAERSMKRLRALGVAIIQFLQDYDNRYEFAPEHFREVFMSYLPSERSFVHPETYEAYAFNGNLSGKSLEDVKQPAETVLFYEGEDEKLKYRYDGKAAVCFADGHTALVTPAEATHLIWKP